MTWSGGMSLLLGASILSCKLKEYMFTFLRNFKELFVSLQSSVKLIWGVDQNVAF